jgi:hypothetical protein
MNRETIKQTAAEMANKNGLINLSRADLCEKIGIPDGSFPHVAECTFTELVAELQSEGVGTHIADSVSKSRVNPALRKEYLLNAAVTIAKKVGYQKVTREAIAVEAGVSAGLITNYLGTMVNLRRDVMRAAIRLGIAEIVAQGLANNDAHARKASPELKEKAARIIANN